MSVTPLPPRDYSNPASPALTASPAASGEPASRREQAAGSSPRGLPQRTEPPVTAQRSKRETPAASGATSSANSVDGKGVSSTDAGRDEQLKRFYDLSSHVISAMPDVTNMAKDLAAKKLLERTGDHLDPDQTWLHHFSNAENSSTSFNGWEHGSPPRHSETLTQAWINNFDASWQDQTANDVNAQAGVYKAGPEAHHYGAENEVRYLASDLRNDIWKDNLQSKVSGAQDKFWSDHQQNWRTMAKGEFIGQARKAYETGALTDRGYDLAMKGGAPDVGRNTPVNVDQLGSKAAPDASVQVNRFDINGYPSSDILRFTGKDGKQVMYLPGESKPFQEFGNEAELKSWVTQQAKDPQAREALEKHFSLYNRQDGVAHTGVDNGLDKLASGKWEGSSIGADAKSQIRKDVFDDLAERAKERMKSDADTMIKSNAEIRTDMWKHYLKAANSTAGVVAGMAGGPIGGLLATGAFAAQLGVQGYQASHGDTERERKTALGDLGADAASALLFGGLTHGAGKSPMKNAGENSQPWFKPPRTLDDGKTGYPLGPTRPPKLPRTGKDFSPEPGPSDVRRDDRPPSAMTPGAADSPQPGTSGIDGRAPQTSPSSGSSPLSGHGNPLNHQPPSPLPDTFSEPSADAFRDIADFGPTELDDIQLHRPQLRPPHPAGVAAAADALYRPANGQNGVTSKIILDASGNQAGCLGLGMLVARTAAGRPGQLDLLSASSLLHGGYADSGPRRARVLDAINTIQSAEWDRSKFGAQAQGLGPRDIPGYQRQLGYHSENSEQLVDALQSGFNPQTNRFGDVPRFAMLSYTFGDDVMQGFNLGHVAFVERSFQNPNYLDDRYTYYDSARGGFSYANFGQLSQALSDYYGLAYPELGGFNSARTFFYNENPGNKA